MSDTSSPTPLGPPDGPRDSLRDGPQDGLGPTGEDRLAKATLLLRQHTDSGWKAIEDTILARARTLFRPSAPVRARHAFGDFFVAADVIVAELRQAIDDAPGAVAQDIICTVDENDTLESVTIHLIVAYGASLLDVAATVHRLTLQELRDLLGDLAPDAAAVHTHVHVGDVSDDPRIVS